MDEELAQPDLLMFLASTAHDMKNSISILSGTLENLLADSSDKHAAGYRSMGQMLYETRRLNNNLIQLLALYKEVGRNGYPYDPQTLQLSELVEQVVGQNRILLESKNITVETECDPDLIWVLDEDLILGVVGQAINNATQYTRDRIFLIVQERDGMLEIRVEDNGDGYPDSMLEAGKADLGALRRGVNFASHSTALGLYFSAEVAKMHKHRGVTGHISLENGGRGGGGCFILRLP